MEFKFYGGETPCGMTPKLIAVNNHICSYPLTFSLNFLGKLEESYLLEEDKAFMVEMNLSHQEIEELLGFTQQFFFDHIVGKHRTLMGKSLVFKRNGEAELHLSPLVPPLILHWESK